MRISLLTALHLLAEMSFVSGGPSQLGIPRWGAHLGAVCEGSTGVFTDAPGGLA